jgi:DNA-binding CsgD family transcriptional regulator/tetratricopeptide (TPR) repeat protein
MIRPVAADGRIETGGAFTPIPRPRVVERITSAAMQRIVLIVAPAGYGKSVALREYLDTLKERHVRYDVRAENASLLGFVRGFADALLELAPDARRTVSGAYDKSLSSTTPGSDLAMWMHAHIKSFTGTIAIDDLHLAENEREVSKFLVSLIERTKGRARWIIASRSSLDLPVGSWLAYGEMDLNIDEQDLRFTLDEARATAKVSRVGVRDEELAEILSMTEGWPTALSFALRTSTRSADLRNISATTREMVYRYLAEQVYRTLDAEERDLLQFIAFLPEIDLEVLRHAGYDRAKAVVEALRDRVAFMYPDRPGVYRCQDLFRDFLQHELLLEGDAAAEAMRRRVGRALEEAGKIPAALQLYAQLRSQPDLLRLLHAHGFSLVDQAHGDAVSSALDALSQEARATNSLVLALRGVREADSGRFDRGESLLQRAIQRSTDHLVTAKLSLRLALLLWSQRRDAAALLEPVLEQEIPEDVRAAAVSLLAPSYANAGRIEDAQRMVDLCADFAQTIESDELRSRIFHRMGSASLTLGKAPDHVASLFNSAQALALQHGLYSLAAVALGGLHIVTLFYEDDVARSSWYAQQAMNAALKAGDRYSMQTSLLQLINVEAQRGNAERLPQLEQQFSTAVTSDPGRSLHIVPTRAIMAAWNGRFDEAYRLMSTIAGRQYYVYNFDGAYLNALYALYSLASNQRDNAMEISRSTLDEIASSEVSFLHGKRYAEAARFICAITEAFAGRVTSANRILQRRGSIEDSCTAAMRDLAVAVCRAQKNAALLPEVRDAAHQLHSVGYGGIARVVQTAADRILSASPVLGEGSLTRTELDVLRSLSEGLSPKEIAQEAGRSVYTVQAHIQNAIRKLGCSGRNEALTVARKRGLLG